MENFYGKKYKLEKSENFEQFLKFLEVGYLARHNALKMSPVSCLTRHVDGSYTYSLVIYESERHSTAITFYEGKEFLETRGDQVKVMSTVVFEGNKMIHTQVEMNGRKVTHTREFTEDTLTVISTAEGWDGKSKRIYKLIRT